MAERLITIEGIDPIELYGPKNSNLRTIANFFPKLKFVARNNDLKVIGIEEEIDLFDNKLHLFIEYYQKFNVLDEDKIENLMQANAKEFMNLSADNSKALVFGNTGKPITAKTINQKRLVTEFDVNDLIFAVGPAGTGKTYTAIALAVRALKNKEVKKIILTRPAVEAGEKLGFLPGDMKDKLDPYLQPLYDALHDMIHPKKLVEYLEDGIVQIAPLAYMRGRTLDNACVILDEAQNTTVNQLKMFLTRMGKSAKFIVTGDVTQIDLPRNETSGLIIGMDILKDSKGIAIINFDNRDIIRHSLVKVIVSAYDKYLETKEKK